MTPSVASTSDLTDSSVVTSITLPGTTSYQTGMPVASSSTITSLLCSAAAPVPWEDRALNGLSARSLGSGVEST